MTKKEDALKTIKLAKKLKLYLATFGVTVAYPGTEIYEWAIKNNTIKDKFWYMKKDTKIARSVRDIDGNLNLKDFPTKEQKKIVKKANRSFYLRPSFILKQLLRLKTKQDIQRVIKSVRELIF